MTNKTLVALIPESNELTAKVETLRTMNKQLDGINELCQDIALLSCRRFNTGANQYNDKHNLKKVDVKEFCIPTNEIPELDRIKDLCTSSIYKVFVRKAFRAFFSRYMGLSFKSDGTLKAQRLTLGSIRKNMGEIEKLKETNQFPILIEENTEKVKEPSKKEVKSARQLIDELAKKLKKDSEKDRTIEGAGEFSRILTFIRENPNIIEFVCKENLLMNFLVSNPSAVEALATMQRTSK